MKIEEATCRHCGTAGEIRIEWRRELWVRSLGSFSLAGRQLKGSGNWVEWPWAVCGACGHKSRGEL